MQILDQPDDCAVRRRSAPSTTCSPLLRSIAVIRPYGGFISGSPRGPATVRVTPARYADRSRFGVARKQVRDEGIGHRRHVQHAGLGIERRARPVGAAHRSRQLDGPLRFVRSVADDRRRREQRTDPYLFDDLERLRTQLRREVDQIVFVTPWRSNAGGLVGNGCVGDVFSPGTVDCGTGRSSIGHTGLPFVRSSTYANDCLVT